MFSSRWISSKRRRKSLTLRCTGTEITASMRKIGVPLTGAAYVFVYIDSILTPSFDRVLLSLWTTPGWSMQAAASR